MFYAVIVDANGNGIGSHTYAEQPTSYPANEAACAADQAMNPANWKLSGGALVAATPSIAQQAANLLNTGMAVTSASTSALNGTYATDLTSQQHINAEVTSILLNGTFADGNSTIAWLDASGASHTFTAAQFKDFATAVAAFVSGCLRCVNGQSTTLPSASATII